MKQQTILIADSGSTKTDWALCKADGSVTTCTTQGINPIHQTADTIRLVLQEELLPQVLAGTATPPPAAAIYFYGSGCTPACSPLVQQVLREVFPAAERVAVASDLLGAARALCGHAAGMACILGTGANSGLYDGASIVQNTPALGYVLGDEGSGAVLGRCFLNAIFKDVRLAAVRDAFLSEWQLTVADVIQRVYREPLPNRFLASLSPFIHARLDVPALRQLVVDNFRQFFRRNLLPYGRQDLPAHFVGSMAYCYRDLLAEAARAEGFALGRVLQGPLAGLVAYHAEELA